MSTVRVQTISTLVGHSEITVTSLVTCNLGNKFCSEYLANKIIKKFNNIQSVGIEHNLSIKLLVKSKAVCSPDDTFNENYGIKLAEKRNIKKAYKQIGHIISYINELYIDSSYELIDLSKKLNVYYFNAQINTAG